MSEKKSLNEVAVEALRNRITKVFPAQIRKCVEELTDDQLWVRGNDESNSVGNLILHMSGSMRHYLCRSIGGFEYTRDRPAEFAERGPVPRDQLMSTFNKTIEQAEKTLESFDPGRLIDPIQEPGYGSTLFEQIYSVAVHFAAHAGQIVYATKMMKAGGLDEIWIKSHKLK
ncbi:MAG TPA: DinB family protein [Blastocatellia bacterium]|nr:DinB family protein [Blastocatellia bacterium]